jgi:hypothetical protein
MAVRLIRSLKRMEEANRRANEPEPEPQAICLAWHGRGPRVDASTLVDGQYIAVDVTIWYWPGAIAAEPVTTLHGPCEPEGDGRREYFRWVEEVERVTADACDLGWVSNLDGRRIGRVVEIDRELVTVDLDPDWRVHVPSELPALQTALEEAAGASQ